MTNLNMLSVNQMNAQVALMEMWKSSRDSNYPIQIDKLELKDGARTTKATSRGDLVSSDNWFLIKKPINFYT